MYYVSEFVCQLTSIPGWWSYVNLGKFAAVSTMSDSERRSKLYDKMESDLNEHGAAFLEHGETSQSLSLSDLFTLKDGIVTPVLKVSFE